MSDAFATAELRERVLTAWSASPARFREDANAEEDLVRGGYRDRLLVELAQNAADAAARAGVPGRLRLELTGGPDGAGGHGVLRAANTGAPLDAAGVEGLATLRASAKRDEAGSVGRFGVGFAAVLAVSDEPAVVSTTGGVRFSAAATLAEVTAVPALAAEVARRDGGVPVLRLPWPADGAPPAGYATEVVLPLRAGSRAAVHAALGALTPELLLALPGLAEVEVVDAGGTRVLRCARSGGTALLTDGGRTTTWRLAERSGELPAELLADRPVEERARRGYTVTWAVPLDDDGRPAPLPVPQAVHAPTPSDEPLSLPARLLAPFPLGPDRRHVLPGPVTDALVDVAADAYADLVAALAGDPDDPAALALVPRVGLAAAELDAALGTAVLDRLRSSAWLPAAGHPGSRLAAGRAAVLAEPTPERVAALVDVVPGLLPEAWSRRSHAPALAALGVRRVGTAEVAEAVSGVDRPAAWWARLYAALDGASREELGALPVPLADGRRAPGPAGVLLPEPGLPAAELGPLPLRLADPGAAGPPAARRLLERLGARPATAAQVLADPAVRAAVEASLETAEDPTGHPAALADAVLALVAAAAPAPGELPWLADLALPDAAGGWAPAGELLLPGSPFAEVVEPGALGVLDAATAAAHDPAVLRAVGVLDSFALVRADDPDELDVDAAAEWVDAVVDRLPPDAEPPRWPPVTAVRDLELVTDWAHALPMLAALPAQARDDVRLGDVAVPGYLRWWLRGRPVLDGRRPDRLRAPDGAELQGLYEPAQAPPEVLELLAPAATLAEVLADPDAAVDLLDRLGDPARTVRADVLRTVHARLAGALDGLDVAPPARLRVAPDRVADPDRERVLVLDLPWLLPLVDGLLVPAGGAPGPVADLLDVPLASEEVAAAVDGRPDRTLRWADVPGAALAAARLGVPELTGQVAVHARLTAGGRPVPWWPDGARDHVDGTPAALGRALAWRAGAWPLRQALAEAFAHPDRADVLAAEDGV
ncbi:MULTISPECIES: sacsin N-terminal ATP-binding-like domain-containing protein [unclassified Blastococcus]